MNDDGLSMRDVHADHSKKEIHKIYYEAFCPEERFPFEAVYKSSLNDGNAMYAIHDGSAVIGFVYVIFNESVLYLEYLAISGEYRDHGYGSQIINLIKEKYPHKAIVIDMQEEASDPVGYKRRVHFYTGNGFYKTGLRLSFDETSEEEIWTTDPTLKIDGELMKSLFSKQFTEDGWSRIHEHLPIIIKD